VRGLIEDSRLSLFNRAIAGQYPPGSTFKLVVGIGALQEGVANRSTRIRSDGGLRVPNPYDPRRFTWFPDWAALGDLNFVQGLALSSNVYFATLAGGFGDFRGLEEDRLARYARLLGYGERTGIDLPSEEAGRVPTPAWKLANFAEGWFTGDTYNMAIGQGFVLATPLQVAAVTNAIANGGTLVRPHVARALLDQEGRVLRSFTPPTRELALRRDVVPLMREAMLETLNTSQLASQRLPQVRVGGKTGTAEFLGPRDARGNLPTHAWFTAFAPYEAPEMAVTVFVERGGSSTNAVPIAMEIVRAYLDLRDGSRR
jgi:penicillin-binding protein 2